MGVTDNVFQWEYLLLRGAMHSGAHELPEQQLRRLRKLRGTRRDLPAR